MPTHSRTADAGGAGATLRRLVASPGFALCHAADGSAFVVGEAEPYPQFWLSEREGLLFALFGRKGGLPVERAVEALLALRPARDAPAERRRIRRAIAAMAAAGVLVAPDGELSRYGQAMARDYRQHRPFPPELAQAMADAAGLDGQGAVLDLASGPGSLALELARRTPRVTIMELSRGFVAAAREEARARGLALDAITESCNRLPQHDGLYDLVTVSQALHWLDDVAVCKGVCRVLAAGGSFMVVHAALSLPAEHPLAWLLGDASALGAKSPLPFAEQVRPLYRRLALLFAALDAPGVERHDPLHAPDGRGAIAGEGIALYRQNRPIGEGFARAFLTERHLAVLAEPAEQVWQRIARDCARAGPAGLAGTIDWAVLHFRRGGRGLSAEGWVPGAPAPLGFS